MIAEVQSGFRRGRGCTDQIFMALPPAPQTLVRQIWREFRIWNNHKKMKENDVKTILFSLAYLTPIKFPFCMSTGEREREREREERERERD